MEAIRQVLGTETIEIKLARAPFSTRTKPYKTYQGRMFHEKTPDDVVYVLSTLHTKQRVRLFIGDAETGMDWVEQADVVGEVYFNEDAWSDAWLKGRKAGIGTAIPTQNIVKIMDTKTNETLYEHPTYHLPKWTIIDQESSLFEEEWHEEGSIALVIEDEDVRLFKTERNLFVFLDFALGIRHAVGGRPMLQENQEQPEDMDDTEEQVTCLEAGQSAAVTLTTEESEPIMVEVVAEGVSHPTVEVHVEEVRVAIQEAAVELIDGSECSATSSEENIGQRLESFEEVKRPVTILDLWHRKRPLGTVRATEHSHSRAAPITASRRPLSVQLSLFDWARQEGSGGMSRKAVGRPRKRKRYPSMVCQQLNLFELALEA